MKISIFGLGYVGTVCAVCLASAGHQVVGVDVNAAKVDGINRGESPIVEPGVEDLLHDALSRGALYATRDVTEAVTNTDVSLICVGTPSNPNGSLNVEQVMHVAAEIGAALKQKRRYHGIAVLSTVLPGTTAHVIGVLEQSSGKTAHRDFGVASNPEFLREGTSIDDFQNPPYTVIGTDDARMVALLGEMYRGITTRFHVVRTQESELLKYACNAFHAVKVVFANEIGAVSKQLGIDSHAVMNIFTEDVKLNISPNYLKPAFAFGGSCLPKDVRAITYAARTLDVTTPLLNSLVVSNEVHIRRVVDWVIEKGRKRVGVLGLSFKSDTDDLRESPILQVVETLLGKGFAVEIYDANVDFTRLVGANRSFVEHELPHYSSLMRSSIEEVVDDAEVILIANRGAGFDDVLKMLRPDQIVLDLVRIAKDPVNAAGGYEGIGW